MRRIATLVILGSLFSCAGLAMAEAPAGKDYHDQDLTGKTFEKASLNDANFSDATLKGVSFLSASLKRATFKGANVDGAAFGGADLTEADMRGTTGIADFRGVNLTGANFEGVKFFPGLWCKCRGANLRKAVITGVIGEVDFTKANFCGASLRGMIISGTNVVFKGALYNDDTSFPDTFDPKAAGMVMEKDVAAAVVVPETPKDRDFHDQDCQGKSFANGTLNGADFSDAILKNVSFLGASLKRASFKGADTTGANFSTANLTGADMRGTTGAFYCASANMTEVNLEGVKFAPGLWCKCRGANLRKAVITGVIGEVDFTKANFCGASLRGMIFSGNNIVFKGATYDDDTSFPDTFDPKGAGMVLVKADDADKK